MPSFLMLIQILYNHPNVIIRETSYDISDSSTNIITTEKHYPPELERFISRALEIGECSLLTYRQSSQNYIQMGKLHQLMSYFICLPHDRHS